MFVKLAAGGRHLQVKWELKVRAGPRARPRARRISARGSVRYVARLIKRTNRPTSASATIEPVEGPAPFVYLISELAKPWLGASASVALARQLRAIAYTSAPRALRSLSQCARRTAKLSRPLLSPLGASRSSLLAGSW